MRVATFTIGGERRIGRVDESEATVAPFDIPAGDADTGVAALVTRNGPLPATLSSIRLDRVAEAHRHASAATEMQDFERFDSELHHRIFACSRNELLREMHNVLRVLRGQNAWFEMKRRSFTEERRERYCLEHQALVDALFRRDPEAARSAMLSHLQSVEANLLRG